MEEIYLDFIKIILKQMVEYRDQLTETKNAIAAMEHNYDQGWYDCEKKIFEQEQSGGYKDWIR